MAIACHDEDVALLFMIPLLAKQRQLKGRTSPSSTSNSALARKQESPTQCILQGHRSAG
jgi:hypothetical protein